MNELYQTKLKEYVNSISGMREFSAVSPLRLETQFESLCDWSQMNSFDEVRNWFLNQRKTCHMKVSVIPLKECHGWEWNRENGNFTHQSGEFFRVEGLRVTQTGAREVGGSGWDQPIMTQVGYDGGLLGIIRKRFNGVPHYLIEAKAEPGNYELVQMSPTLQATFSNLKRAHGGRKPAYAEYFESPELNSGFQVLYKQWLSEDGGRLFLKRNLGMLIEVPEETQFELSETFTWMSLWQIKQFLHENAWVNPHIRGIIAHF